MTLTEPKHHYTWARLYSHTDRRQLYQILSPLSDNENLGPRPIHPKWESFPIRLTPFPFAETVDMQEREERRNKILKTKTTTLDDRPYLGAVWQPHLPDKLIIATRRISDIITASITAEMKAEEQSKPSHPVLIKIL